MRRLIPLRCVGDGVGREYTRILKGGAAEATLKPTESFVGGVGAGFVSVLLTQPFDVVKTRLQSVVHRRVQDGDPNCVPTVVMRIRYDSTLECFRAILREEGAATLYTGTLARCARVVPGSGLIFMSAELVYNACERTYR